MNSYLGKLTTEKINQNTKNIDTLDTLKMLEVINMEDSKVALAVKNEIPNIAKAVDLVSSRLKEGGRLFYVGAGTSGRLGVLDASECPPTYGTDPDMVQGLIAGGNEAVFKAVEGAEDSEEMGRQLIHDKKICKKDVVAGITASGRTPFVLGAVREAEKNGISTIGISNNENSIIKKEADIAITPVVGPEVVMGSTRMKSGTAQKLVLNMITTASMIKLGKVYGNLMVDLNANNSKLVDRAVRIVMYATDADEDKAEKCLKEADFNSKLAIVMIKTNTKKEEAEKLLEKADGFVTNAIRIHK